MAKVINVRPKGGSTYNTLPGSTGEQTNEAGTITDTIFGQTFQSTESGLINWGISTNAFYKGFAGYKCTIKRTGTSTAVTGGTMSQVQGQRYGIDSEANSVWNRNESVTIYDGGSAVSDSDIEAINYLFGEVVFASGYTVTGDITADFEYFPLEDWAAPNTINLTQTAESNQVTNIHTAKTSNGYHLFDPGLRTVELSLSGFHKPAANLIQSLRDSEEVIVEINPDGNNKSRCRGFFRLTNQSQSGDVGAVEEEELTASLNVPAQADVEVPFAWKHASDTTLPTSIRDLLDAWEAETKIEAQYLPDGTSGVEGDTVVTEVSFSTGLEEMNEYSVTLQGDGEQSDVSP